MFMARLPLLLLLLLLLVEVLLFRRATAVASAIVRHGNSGL